MLDFGWSMWKDGVAINREKGFAGWGVKVWRWFAVLDVRCLSDIQVKTMSRKLDVKVLRGIWRETHVWELP